MATTEKADPVGTSFLTIVEILEALNAVQPAVAGPEVKAKLAEVREQWTPKE